MDSIKVRRYLERILNRIPGVRVRFWMVFEKPFESFSEPSTLRDRLSFKEISASDAEVLGTVNPNLSTAVITKRFDNGNRCFVTDYDGVPAFYAWVLPNACSGRLHVNRFTEMHVDLALALGACYYWDVFTRPDFRRRGLLQSSTREIARILLREDYGGFTTVVSVSNRASASAFSKMGFEQRTVLTHLRLWNRDLYVGACDTRPFTRSVEPADSLSRNG